MSAVARLVIARVARRNRIDLAFKNTARRAAMQPKPTRIVLAVWHGEPAVTRG